MNTPRRLRILEVAALPFPSRQGTQVLLDAICRGLAARGHEIHLLVHAHGAFPIDPPYRIRRLGDFPRFRSLRSGPDWRRAALDLRLAVALRALARELRPDAIHLHNVEAAAAALLPPLRPAAPCVYHAHNLMEHELPLYGSLPATFARRLGRWLDAALPRRADLTLAVSEPTRAGLLAAGADPARIVTVEPGIDLVDLAGHPVPAQDPRPKTQDHPFSLAHLGNLDRYQGLDVVLEALGVLRRDGRPAELVAVTESDATELRRSAARLGVPVRAAAHGSLAEALAPVRGCDAAVLARSVPGGFPIKLPVLLSAGMRIATTRSAVEGLDVGDVVWTAASDEPETLAEALRSAATDPGGDARVALGVRRARERWSSAAAAQRLEAVLASIAR